MTATKTPLEPSREQALIHAAQHGDSAAFDHLVRQYQSYLYRLMVRACHHPQDAEEVASEAFARAYARLGQFEGRSSFVSWLGRIATNLCFRRRERVELPSVSLEEEAREEAGHRDRTPPASTPTPEQSALQAEMRRMIRAAVAELPEPEQTVLRLRDIEQYSAAETAERTGLTIPAVKARLHRARGRLRERLNAYLFAED
ncbi:MAG: polymerase sigma factor, sigma-70 family [Armatimonadetes bacterium]|jgi:RNA polymerase sigma-70 factor (ECF subfamily)|nr:polymerase sigma factor, sigma-70 family [Armatimonadota bacterium]